MLYGSITDLRLDVSSYELATISDLMGVRGTEARDALNRWIEYIGYF